MAFQLPPLPYPENALEPYISGETLSFHHGKHHKTYVDTLNELIAGTQLENMSLGEIIQATAQDEEANKVFNNAGQAWNHTFFWHCLRPGSGGNGIPDSLARRIDQDLGGHDNFVQEFTAKAKDQFGSGWAWLVLDGGQLKITTTHDAMTPAVHGHLPLLTVDVWEHAYYLDYQNRRPDFVEAVLRNVVNWQFVAENLEFQGEGSQTAARDYDERTARFIRSGQVERGAQAARQALEGAEGDELRRAEAAGKRHARGEDPALRQGEAKSSRSGSSSR